MDLIFILVLMVAMMWFVTSRGKKQQAAARRRLEEALVPDTWIVTIGGFYGRIVDIDGDVVTLESPSGVETIWSRSAIREVKEPPYAIADEEELDTEAETVPDNASSLTGGATDPVVDRSEDGYPESTDDGRENPRP